MKILHTSNWHIKEKHNTFKNIQKEIIDLLIFPRNNIKLIQNINISRQLNNYLFIESSIYKLKRNIDSLFIYEGFGTLDEDSLETALNALNLLQSSGKMVGVISHVEALKERIPLQIRVVPKGDGTSVLNLN